MTSSDRRRVILQSSLFSPDLTAAEKVLMTVVVTINAEYVDGKPRHGSRSMAPNGKFSLHLDYLARATSSSVEAVRKLQRSLARKHHLDLVHEARFGRPTTWQALVVRGAKNGSLTSGQIGTPYGLSDWLIRGADSAPLTYRTPDRRNPAPADCVSPESRGDGEAATESGCRWHGFAACPPDCADHSTTRRSA